MLNNFTHLFSMKRFIALVHKEWLHILRDPSVLLIGFFLPVLLILIFGYGLSMDLKGVPIAIVSEEDTPLTRELTQTFIGSDYMNIVVTAQRHEAEQWFSERKVDAIVHLKSGFTRDAMRGQGRIGVTIHGVDANSATIIRTYINATIGIFQQKKIARAETVRVFSQNDNAPYRIASITPITRAWFNEANTSSWYLVPGLIVLIITLLGSFLTATVVAREWERGTFETLLATPATSLEILFAKFIPYFVITTLGLLLCLLAATLLFEVPVRGSRMLLIVSTLIYQCWALFFGLTLSALLKKQFLAMQYAIIGCFAPALILSGFLFDLRSVPQWIAVLGYIVPPTYAVENIKICFLSGGNTDIVINNILYMALWAVTFFIASICLTRKRIT